MKKKAVTGLVLTGGGARGAYQAGVLRWIAEHSRGQHAPFNIITGSSAGAINAVALAAGAKYFRRTAERIWNIWKNLRHGMVVRSDVATTAGIAVRLALNMALGGIVNLQKSTYLLDTTPLRALLEKEISFRSLRSNLRKGVIKGVAINATNYQSGTNITFYDCPGHTRDWIRSQRISKNAQIGLTHLMASSAIPFFFRPVPLDGSYYGDGSIRLTSPLSPAIHLGAEKVLAIGIRHKRPCDHLLELNRTKMKRIFLADIAGLLLNSIFMDSLDSDIERLQRINRTLAAMGEKERAAHPDRLRPIPLLALNPSMDLGRMATEQFKQFPFLLQHLLKGIGAAGESGGELLSYLAFDTGYTVRLLELGYEDANARKEDILQFLET